MTLPLSITTLIGQPILFTPGMPESFSSYYLKGATPYYAYSEAFGYLICQQISTRNYVGWLTHFILSKAIDLKISSNVEDLLMHYTIKGNLYYVFDNQESLSSDHHLNLVVSRRLKNIIRFKTPGIYSALHIHVPIASLKELSESFPVINIFLEKAENGHTVTLLDHNMVAHGRLRNIVEDICERKLPNVAGEKYREQKIAELIIESLDMLTRYLTDTNGLSATDHERGEKTEVHLLNHLHQPSPPTLRQLARFAGTNEKKLEDIFKLRHGVTVYDFFQNARMSIIYRKLTESNIPLQDLADEFGYTDYSSFSYAVKKRFSLSPRELRKRNLV
ncbi:helix-turn-helix domain-containing protein [Chitinophaga sancti]|uniref:AraC family transcriptional regulator n=1 Tax=Chitinophaga sancti TaxID=1004 RepID=A0A1K1T0V0_9BACT|nr:AraC family transcriptional regulator [Chitinophaga sancti]WQD59564.1 AraC family transcriptional regulator [Chitinophaga sancti]WQG88302.1 AraC family transcriptional regulator [Chitinophaga sancti]SFW89959.1 AraC-type DNA-binding protein [Chitinophaga sancti]